MRKQFSILDFYLFLGSVWGLCLELKHRDSLPIGLIIFMTVFLLSMIGVRIYVLLRD
jgi:hypothetical protein